VPAERSFSDLLIIQSKSRNRLTPERVDLLQQIHINTRALERAERAKTGYPSDKENKQHGEPHKQQEEALIELEDSLIASGENGSNNPELEMPETDNNTCIQSLLDL